MKECFSSFCDEWTTFVACSRCSNVLKISSCGNKKVWKKLQLWENQHSENKAKPEYDTAPRSLPKRTTLIPKNPPKNTSSSIYRTKKSTHPSKKKSSLANFQQKNTKATAPIRAFGSGPKWTPYIKMHQKRSFSLKLAKVRRCPSNSSNKGF